MHEVLTEHREDDVDLGELLDRLRAMLVQGLVAGKEVTADAGAGLARGRSGRRRSRSSSPSCFQNALEHGGAHVSIELAQRNGDVVLTIADDGTASRATREGTGLSIVRALVRDELRGSSSPARRTRAPGRSRRGAEARVFLPAVTVPLVRILVAEDETIIRLDLQGAARERPGFEVCAEARDGEEAVELARETEPDLALLDVKMPRLDGIEAARRILDERPIPIVMVTAYGEQELVSRAVEAGVFGYLVKPFRETDLLPAIETARARHAELVELREEADSLAEALAARKAIERAKGMLMATARDCPRRRRSRGSARRARSPAVRSRSSPRR